jgi:glycosyltransferase involved in cell wall biosynthesis
MLQTPRDEHSAVFLAYQTLANEIAARGGALSIFTPGDFQSSASAGRLMPFLYPSVVRRWVRQHHHEFDLFIFHSYAGWLSAPVCAAARVPFVIAFHGLEPLYHDELRRIVRPSLRYRFLQERLMPAFLKRACSGAALVTCLNSVEREALVDRGWVLRDRVFLARHGVADQFFAPARTFAAARRLLFVGQWLHMKGVPFLVQAADTLLARHPELRLTCAGTLAGAEAVLAAFDRKVRDRVTVAPRLGQRELAELYSSSDMFLFPSLYEGFGRALLEAMASRLPIVTTRVGIAIDALDGQKSCVLIEKRDPSAIVSAVERLIADGALRQRLGDAAHRAAGAFREADTARALGEALTSIADRGAAGLS